jgi:hypothetical protein
MACCEEKQYNVWQKGMPTGAGSLAPPLDTPKNRE